jgi:hypothetical protein
MRIHRPTFLPVVPVPIQPKKLSRPKWAEVKKLKESAQAHRLRIQKLKRRHDSDGSDDTDNDDSSRNFPGDSLDVIV